MTTLIVLIIFIGVLFENNQKQSKELSKKIDKITDAFTEYLDDIADDCDHLNCMPLYDYQEGMTCPDCNKFIEFHWSKNEEA